MLDALFPMPKGSIDSYGGQWYTNRVKTLGGVVVDEEIALTYGAYWCAVRIIVEAESGLRFCTYEKNADGDPVEAPDNPVYQLLDCAPNPVMGAKPFRESVTLPMVNVGNGFGFIERDALNRPAALWPIHPGRVKAPVSGQTTDLGKAVSPFDYLVRNNDGTYQQVEAQDMLHVPGAFPMDGRWGKGCVTYHREVIGAALGADRVAATQFGSGNIPKVVIYDARLKDKEQRREFRRDWKEMHGSPDSGEVAIIWNPNAKLEKLSMSGADAQFLESRRFSKEEMATIVGVPLHMMGIKGAGPQGTIEQRGIEFIIFHLMPWLLSWEAQANLKLFRPADRGRCFAKHRLEGLIRGDMTTRYNCYKIALMIGLLTHNDCLRMEGLPTIGPEGDQRLVPLNLTTLRDLQRGGNAKSRRGLGSDQSGSPAEMDNPEARGLVLPHATRARVNSQIQQLEVILRGQQRDAAAAIAVNSSTLLLPAAAAAGPLTTTAANTADSQREQVRQGLALLEVPDIRQPDHYSCGASAAMAVGQYFGVGPGTIQEWKDALGTTLEFSTRPRRIADYLSRLGLVVTTAHDMTIDDLRAWWRKGCPVIVCVQDYGSRREEGAAYAYGHYLTVIGVDVGYVFCQDSSVENAAHVPGGDVPPAQADNTGNIAAPGRLMVDFETWLANWHDIDAEGAKYIHFGIAAGREVHPDPPAGAPAEQSPRPPRVPSDVQPPPGGTSLRALLLDALGRQLRREQHALTRHRKRPDFDRWLAVYYAKETPYIERALLPLQSLLAAAGLAIEPAAAAAEIAADARATLLACFETGTPAQMTALIEDWGTARAELLADRILNLKGATA